MIRHSSSNRTNNSFRLIYGSFQAFDCFSNSFEFYIYILVQFQKFSLAYGIIKSSLHLSGERFNQFLGCLSSF